MNLFSHKKPVPSLSYSFCVCLDVLGFSEEIKKKSLLGKSSPHLRKFFTTIKKAATSLKDSEYLWEYKIYTDNIVIGTPLDDNRISDDEDFFGLIMICLLEYQLIMVLNGFFVRGGWAVGELYMDDSIVYGNSLLEAYELESQIAKMPRIIFSDNMLKTIAKHLTYYSSAYEPPHKAHILIDEDGKYFINYLYGIYEMYDKINFDIIEKHKNIIVKRLDEFKTNEIILTKYEWCAKYHNYFCDNFIPDCEEKYYIKKSKYVSNFAFITTL